MYIGLVKNDIVNNICKAGKMNLNREEKEAFYALLNNEEIIIRPADKGSGIVVLDKEDYINKLQGEMTGSASYVEAEKDMTEETNKKLKKMVNKMYKEGSINDELRHYLIPKYPRAGKLKGNPKIHKSGAPLRTIVSGINTPTEKIAELAEHELNEYVENTPSYVKDTTDFISKLKTMKTDIPKDAILFCFDVEKLYPSIPRKEGMDACKEALEQRSNPLVTTEDAVKMIEMVLDSNSFTLGDKQYKQVEGIAIGSKLGRNFACTYMRKWDEILLKHDKKPLFYKRYIDDGFGIWDADLDSLLKFTQYANEIHKNIKIELRWSRNCIEFLDTLVKIENGHVYTDLYSKPTDKHLYLRENSCHPPHTKKALAYGLGIRIRRICEKDEDYHKHRWDLKQQLRKRGYSGKLIEQQLCKVDKMNRNDLLKRKKTESKEKRVPIVLTYSKLLPDVRKILRKHQNTLFNSDRMREVFPETPLLAFRRDKNLCDTLVHSKTERTLKFDENCSCGICKIIKRDDIWDTNDKRSFAVVKDAKCTDKNLIYALICKKCDKTIYVGETERTLKERTEEHLRDIRYQKDKPIMKHFNKHDACDMQVAVMRKTTGKNKTYRLIVEEKWIKDLETRVPRGCNIKTNI